MGPYIRYTTLRLLLLLVMLGVFYLAGARSVLLIALAALASMALSYVLLRRQRDEVVASMTQRRMRQDKRGEDELMEDDAHSGTVDR